jgi:mannose-6-phosphate isomerase-like protein (cupin superfamily)
MTYTIENMKRDSQRCLAEFRRRKRLAAHRAYEALYNMKAQRLAHLLVAIGISTLALHATFA